MGPVKTDSLLLNHLKEGSKIPEIAKHKQFHTSNNFTNSKKV